MASTAPGPEMSEEEERATSEVVPPGSLNQDHPGHWMDKMGLDVSRVRRRQREQIGGGD